MATYDFLDLLIQKNVEIYLSVISVVASVTAIILLAINTN